MARQRRSPLLRTPTRLYNDQRTAPRLPTFLRTDFCPLVSSERGLHATGVRRGVATSISASGLFVTQAGQLEVGSLVQLYLRLPDVPANPISCHARVVRAGECSSSGYGLRFFRLRDADARRLTRFVRVQLARSTAPKAAAAAH